MSTKSVILVSLNLCKGVIHQSRCFSAYSLSSKHLAIQNLARKYAKEKLRPIAACLDKENRFPAEQIKELGEIGLLSIAVDEKWNGSGQDLTSVSVAVEEIARACGGTGAIVSIHNCLYASLVNDLANDTQKEKFLKPFSRGTLGCFALSEPDAGSDVGAIQTTATLEDDCYLLNGTKSWVTSGIEAKAAVIFATVNKELKHKGITAFLVPLPIDGLCKGRRDDKLGIKAASSCNFTLDNVRIPKENMLGEIGEGFKIAMIQLDKARIGIASQALGIGQAALDLALEYASQRIAFGRPINQMQAVRMRIAEMALHLESARLLVRRAATINDECGKSTKESAMAKLSASQAATFIAHNCMQILGGVGYVTDLPAERHYRDARITEIYGGITDIQKLLIGELVIKENE